MRTASCLSSILRRAAPVSFLCFGATAFAPRAGLGAQELSLRDRPDPATGPAAAVRPEANSAPIAVDLQELHFASPRLARELRRLSRAKRHTVACLFARPERVEGGFDRGKSFWRIDAVLESTLEPAAACDAPGERGMAIFVRERRPDVDRWFQRIARLLAERPDLGFIVAVTRFANRLDARSGSVVPIPDGPAVFWLTGRGAERREASRTPD